MDKRSTDGAKKRHGGHRIKGGITIESALHKKYFNEDLETMPLREYTALKVLIKEGLVGLIALEVIAREKTVHETQADIVYPLTVSMLTRTRKHKFYDKGGISCEVNADPRPNHILQNAYFREELDVSENGGGRSFLNFEIVRENKARLFFKSIFIDKKAEEREAYEMKIEEFLHLSLSEKAMMLRRGKYV